MSTVWICILVTALFAAVFRGAGPLLVTAASGASRVQRALAVAAPAMLSALIVTSVGGDEPRRP